MLQNIHVPTTDPTPQRAGSDVDDDERDDIR
jgi:hypothetical protein